MTSLTLAVEEELVSYLSGELHVDTLKQSITTSYSIQDRMSLLKLVILVREELDLPQIPLLALEFFLRSTLDVFH